MNHSFYPRQYFVVVGKGVRIWFILHHMPKKLIHSYPRQHRKSSEIFELWSERCFPASLVSSSVISTAVQARRCDIDNFISFIVLLLKFLAGAVVNVLH